MTVLATLTGTADEMMIETTDETAIATTDETAIATGAHEILVGRENT